MTDPTTDTEAVTPEELERALVAAEHAIDLGNTLAVLLRLRQSKLAGVVSQDQVEAAANTMSDTRKEHPGCTYDTLIYAALPDLGLVRDA